MKMTYMLKFRLISILIFSQVVVETFAGNPLTKPIGMADPHIFIKDGTAYMFATHDYSYDSRGFTMKDWWVWKSEDLVNWAQISTLYPENIFLKVKDFKTCWATFGVYKNKHWYYYFSAGTSEIGVVMSDSPEGPWIDPLGKPLVAKGDFDTMSRDPDIIIDDNGDTYIIFGTFNYYIAKLNEDMISFNRMPQLVTIKNPQGPVAPGRTDDKPSLHKYNGKYYLSWSGYYAISDNIFGPYDYTGCVWKQENITAELTPTGAEENLFGGNRPQGGIDTSAMTKEEREEMKKIMALMGGNPQNNRPVQKKTVPKFVDEDRHGNFFTLNNQWYYVCNDKGTPGTKGTFRSSIITYVHYKNNGEIAPVKLDAIGVGSYDASLGAIEAENYFAAKGIIKNECGNDGFQVILNAHGSYVAYQKIKNIPENAGIKFKVANSSTKESVIQVRKDAPDGTLLGTCTVSPTKGQFLTVSCDVKFNRNAAENNIYLVASSAGLRIDSFEIK